MWREYNAVLQTVVAALSGGGIALADKKENLDRDLIMTTCREDGVILRPNSPVKATQAQILKMAFGGSDKSCFSRAKVNIFFPFCTGGHNPLHPHSLYYGDLWHTHSALEAADGDTLLSMDFLFAAETSSSLGPVAMSDLPLASARASASVVLFSSDDDFSAASPSVLEVADASLDVPELEDFDFRLWYVAPLLEMVEEGGADSAGVSVAVLGEKGKVVRLSQQRVTGLTMSGQSAIDIQIQVGRAIATRVVVADAASTIPTTMTAKCALVISLIEATN